MRLKAYSIIVDVKSDFINGKSALYINGVYITDRHGVHAFQCKKTIQAQSLDACIAYGYKIAINNGYRKPTYYTDFGTAFFDNIRILHDSTLHNYPYRYSTIGDDKICL